MKRLLVAALAVVWLAVPAGAAVLSIYTPLDHDEGTSGYFEKDGFRVDMEFFGFGFESRDMRLGTSYVGYNATLRSIRISRTDGAMFSLGDFSLGRPYTGMVTYYKYRDQFGTPYENSQYQYWDMLRIANQDISRDYNPWVTPLNYGNTFSRSSFVEFSLTGHPIDPCAPYNVNRTTSLQHLIKMHCAGSDVPGQFDITTWRDGPRNDRGNVVVTDFQVGAPKPVPLPASAPLYVLALGLGLWSRRKGEKHA